MNNVAFRRLAPFAPAFVVLLATSALQAQTAPSTEAPAPEPTILSPFIVDTTRDTGWSANETLSANRTSQALKDVPLSIDAITSEFMEDLGLHTSFDVAGFVANVHAVSPLLESDVDEDGWSFRGLSQRFNISRNYFRWYIATDNYNIERIDFGKGSNSLIFGDVEPGGQGSAFTKRARMSHFGSALVQMNTLEGYRAQVDINRRLLNNLAIRFNAVRREDRTYQDFSEYGLEAEHLAVSWTPFRNTQVRIEGEQGDFQNARGWAGILIREESARSRGFSSTNGWQVTSDGDVFLRSTLLAPDRTAANQAAGGALSLLEGRSLDVRMRNTAGQTVGARSFAGLPREVNIRGTYDQFGRPFGAISAYVEQRIGNLGLELAYSHQNQRNFRVDSYFARTISLDVNGRPFIDSSGIDHKTFQNRVDAYRFTAAYPWQPFKWMRQLLVLSGDYSEDFNSRYTTQLYNWANIDNGTAQTLPTNQRVYFRLYLDDPRWYSKAAFDQFLEPNLPRTGAFRAAQYGTPGLDNNSAFRQLSSVGASATGSYFRGRVQSLIGVRRDWSKELNYISTRRAEYGQRIVPPHPRNAKPGDYELDPSLHVGHTSTSLGVTYAISRDINVYASHGTSFRWQDAQTFDLKEFGPILGTTKEIGLKGDLFRKKVAFTLAVFDIKRDNVEYRWTPSNFSGGDVEDLMNPNNISQDDPRYRRSNRDVNQFRDVVSAETSKGFDATVLTRPVPGLQARFTVGRTQVTTKPDFSSFREFYEAALQRGDENPAVIADAKLVLDSSDNVGKPNGVRASPWSASWALDYSFARGVWQPLRGVRCGLNGIWRDDYRFGINDGVEYMGGATHTVGAYIMRDQKLFGRVVRARLGGRYLFDFENGDVRRTGFAVRANGLAEYTYAYSPEPLIDLSVSVKF